MVYILFFKEPEPLYLL